MRSSYRFADKAGTGERVARPRRRLKVADWQAEEDRCRADAEAERLDGSDLARLNLNPFGGCQCCWLEARLDLEETLRERRKAEARRKPAGLPIRLGLLGRVIVG